MHHDHVALDDQEGPDVAAPREGDLGIMMTVREMLDLPPEERSRYLAAIPLTISYTMDCLDGQYVLDFRHILLDHGGVYREVYGPYGMYWVVTFKTQADMRACTRALVDWLNEELETSHALHHHITREDLDEMRYHTATFARPEKVPALEYEIVDAINPYRPATSRKVADPILGE